MNRKRAGIRVGLCTVVVIGFIGAIVTSMKEAKPQTPGALAAVENPAVAPDRRRKANLRKIVRQTRREREARRASGELEHQPDVLPEHSLARKEEMLARINHVYWDRAPALYDDVLNEQEVDDARTLLATRRAETILKEERFAQTEMDSLICAQMYCRSVMTHENEEAYKAFSLNAIHMEEGPWDGAVRAFRTVLPDGRIQTRLFFADQGEDELLHQEVRARLYAEMTASEWP